MKIIIGFIILLLVIIVIGYFIKKKYYKEMDRLESWKLDLTNRPVLDEMSKVKQLNMTGQTEELFERWRNQWDDLVTVDLPDLEELLFDAEEYIDRYRFYKAKDVQRLIEQKLIGAEDQITNILEELNELVGSEEKNRIEIEQLKELYREAKKNLLAHRYNFGEAESQLSKTLDEVINRFQEFDEKTGNGNYLEARETVLMIKNQMEQTINNMELIPQLLIECQSNLPSQLSDVREGFREMEQQGYYLEHVQVENEIIILEEKLEESIGFIKGTETSKAEAEIKEIKARVEILFDLLEKEVHAKHYVVQNEKLAKILLETIQEENDQLNNEVTQVLESYHLTEKDFETQSKLEKELNLVYKHFNALAEKLNRNETAQTANEVELIEIKGQLDAIRDQQHHFLTKLQDLRKDEYEAREKIKELTKQVGDMIRLVSKSNIPGLPENYKYLFEDGKESIENVKLQLEEKPLNISAVNQYLEIAVLTVEKLVNTTNDMLENVMLAEKVIQYGNRYRSQYPSISRALVEAEKAFRNYDYQKALEQAATSIEEIDPTAIKKIENLLSKGY
ncbi:septation ring formation regulator EzrA [Neobacillus sp. PS3-40]|jgi:septation ring formation regulator|uniref:septation ring formation regulator EzrA n=1 Tax=Neobacillus sp. PS3-40 TaxID=3070679 RepID=UPI0027DF8B35|nr:septation ring formation regulator EzrA [Neobacillus sp. PS3-40]WML45669.1 septation ring formation regulator EzrA [Neobacillus sp. PS3-40]